MLEEACNNFPREAFGFVNSRKGRIPCAARSDLNRRG